MESNNTILAELRIQFPAKVMKVDPYFGSFIRFDILNNSGSEMSVHLYLCDWEFFENSVTLAASDSDAETWRPILASLVQSKIIDLVQQNENCLELLFESGRSIVVSANLDEYEDDDDLIWITLSDHIVAYSPKSAFIKESKASGTG